MPDDKEVPYKSGEEPIRIIRSPYLRIKNDGHGLTDTEVLYERTNWRMEREKVEELKKLVEDLGNINPRRLTDEDFDIVEGKSFRGTSLFLTLLSLYATGRISSIRDFSVHSAGNTGIQIREVLSSRNKNVAGGYANKYFEYNSNNLVPEFLRTEGKIFQRVLADNSLPEMQFPPIMLQPILIGFNADSWHDEFEHKGYEGIQYSSAPNQATLNLMSRLVGQTTEEFAAKYPIISRKFEQTPNPNQLAIST